MPICGAVCVPGTSCWIEEFTFTYKNCTIQAAPGQKTEQQVCAGKRGASGEAGSSPARSGDLTALSHTVILCRWEIIRKTPFKAGLRQERFLFDLHENSRAARLSINDEHYYSLHSGKARLQPRAQGSSPRLRRRPSQGKFSLHPCMT